MIMLCNDQVQNLVSSHNLLSENFSFASFYGFSIYLQSLEFSFLLGHSSLSASLIYHAQSNYPSNTYISIESMNSNLIAYASYTYTDIGPTYKIYTLQFYM